MDVNVGRRIVMAIRPRNIESERALLSTGRSRKNKDVMCRFMLSNCLLEIFWIKDEFPAEFV